MMPFPLSPTFLGPLSFGLCILNRSDDLVVEVRGLVQIARSLKVVLAWQAESANKCTICERQQQQTTTLGFALDLGRRTLLIAQGAKLLKIVGHGLHLGPNASQRPFTSSLGQEPTGFSGSHSARLGEDSP